MNDFKTFKLNRTIWVSYLVNRKFNEGIKYYEEYVLELNKFLNTYEKNIDVKNEIYTSETIFKDLMLQLADNFYNEKNFSDALVCYLKYYKNDKKNIEIIKKIITIANKYQQYDISDMLIDEVEEWSKSDVNAYKELALLYTDKNQFKKAVETYDKYYLAKGEKRDINDYNLYGYFYNRLFNDTLEIDYAYKGLDFYKKSLEIDGTNSQVLRSNIIMCSLVNDEETNKELWKTYIAHCKMSNDDKFDYAAHCLKIGDFENWHKYFESRFDKETDNSVFPKISAPRWTGNEYISKLTLLIYYEQGFGDTFWLAGYINRLKKIAGNIIFVTQNGIADLIKSSDLGIEVYDEAKVDINNLTFDYYIPSMSIPIVLKLDESNISVGGGYLKPNKELVKEFKEKFCDNNKFKIGICGFGNSLGDRKRDIDVKYFKALESLDNIEIYSLNKTKVNNYYKCFEKYQVHTEVNTFENFEQTAALIENMDLVITSDNVILNLAGALGKKTFALFNWCNQFRWFDLSGDDVVYYNCVKPFVNDKMNNWEYSMKNVVEEIKKIL